MKTKNLITTLAGATALTTLLTISVAAQPPIERGARGGQLWTGLAADFDQDQDGQVTLDEFGGAEATFSNLDRNGDGVVSADDFAGGRGARKRFMRGAMVGGFILHAADADQDKVITSAEFDTFLATVDANSDGTIEREELHAVLAASAPGRGGERPGHRGQGPRENPLDQDGDGILEVDDLRQIFAEVDANSDGQITEDEVPHIRARHRARGKSGGPGRQGQGGQHRDMGGPSRGHRAAALIAHRADADDDGEVPSAEWQTLTAELDADGNGEIISAEWSAVFPGRGDGEAPPEHFARVIRFFDENDNEVLETADFDLLFTELDADASGTLEAEELPRRRHRGPRG